MSFLVHKKNGGSESTTFFRILIRADNAPLRLAATQDEFLQSGRHVWRKTGATNPFCSRPLAANPSRALFDFQFTHMFRNANHLRSPYASIAIYLMPRSRLRKWRSFMVIALKSKLHAATRFRGFRTKTGN